MAALTIQNVVDAGTKPNFGLNTPTSSDTATIGNGTNTIVVYKNTDTNVKTLTLAGHGTTGYGDAFPNHVVTLGANTGEVWIPLRKDYDDGSGSATIALTGTGGVTGVTVALVRLG